MLVRSNDGSSTFLEGYVERWNESLEQRWLLKLNDSVDNVWSS